MRATSLFSLRRAVLPQTLPGILLVLLLLALGFRWVHNVCNPQDLNHLMILDMSNREYGLPLTVSLDGEFGWTESFGGGASKLVRNGAIYTFNIERAWPSGVFTLKDSEGLILAKNEIRPRGRYCGTLVVVLLPDAESACAFNELPEGVLKQGTGIGLAE